MQVHDIVFTGGRVVDPASGTDEVRSIAITDGTVSAWATTRSKPSGPSM